MARLGLLQVLKLRNLLVVAVAVIVVLCVVQTLIVAARLAVVKSVFNLSFDLFNRYCGDPL